MTLGIILFSILIFLAGLIIMISPGKVFGWLDRYRETPGLHVVAVGTRLILGALLIIQSAYSRYPDLIEIIGWIAIVAGVILAIIGRNRFKQLMSWAMSLVTPFGRVAGVAAACFGAFLVYAFT